MHLLYLDESGVDPCLPYYVLAGVSIPERQSRFMDADLVDVARRFRPHDTDDDGLSPPFSASAMHTGAGRWRGVDRMSARQAIKDALQLAVADRQKYGVRLFAAAICRSRLEADAVPSVVAFDQMLTRFDFMIGRLNRRDDHPVERGLLLLNGASQLARRPHSAASFSDVGYSTSKVKNLAEVPVCLLPRQSRLMQLADLVAYAVYRYFERNDSQYFDIIKGCFDRDEHKRYGLYAISPDQF